MFYSDFLSFYLTFFFCSKIPSRITHYIQLTCLLRLLWAVTLSQTFLAVDDFSVLRIAGQMFCRVSLKRDLPTVSHDQTEAMGLGRKTTWWMECRCHHRASAAWRLSAGLAAVVLLEHLTGEVFARCLHYMALLTPSSHCVQCGEEGRCVQPTLQGHNLAFLNFKFDMSSQRKSKSIYAQDEGLLPY